jgi:site-specific DNA recombinase
MIPMPRKDKVKKQRDNEVKVKRAVIYCRVSTRNQGESGLSLDLQMNRCRSYCEAQGWQIVKEYSDVASAKDLLRPEMQKLLLSANKNEFDVVVSLKLDRISRVPRDFYGLFDDLGEIGVGLAVVEDNIDTTTAVGRMLVGILLQFAAFEREIGIERSQAAGDQRASEGRPGGGVPPLGYDRVEKHFHINAEEAKIIKRIYREYLLGMSPAGIASRLNTEGFRTKMHLKKDGSFRCGGRSFDMKILHTHITNPLYKGMIFHSGNNYQGLHEPIIDPDRWEQAQLIVQRNAKKKNLGNSVHNQHLLNGMMTCGICGDILSTSAGSGKVKVYHYYKCMSTMYKGRRENCNNSPIRADLLEGIVVDLVKNIANSDAFFDATKKAIDESLNQEDIHKLKAGIQKVAGEESEIAKRLANIVNLIGNDQIDNIATLNKELSNLEGQRASLIKRREVLGEELSFKVSNPPDPIKLRILYQEFNDIWDDLSQSERTNIVKLLINDVVVNTPKGSKKGVVTVTLYQKPPIKSFKDLTKGSRVITLLLRRRDLNSQPSD